MRNVDRMFVNTNFKRLVKMEAASHGKSIIEFTEEIAEQDKRIEELAQEWKGKWKVRPQPRFDFP